MGTMVSISRLSWWVFAAMCTVILSVGHSPSAQAAANVVIDLSRTCSVTGKDDVQRLKLLASGVGWEFAPNARTTEELKRVGIKSLRCINVDPLPGEFDNKGKFIVGNPTRLSAHLKTCREIGAAPHIIIAQGLCHELQAKGGASEKAPGVMGQESASDGPYGPSDWVKFESYCLAYFDYVLIKQRFPDARFEVGNEPDIAGQFPRPPGSGKLAMGSKEIYAAYLNVYRHVALAAREFERRHPGLRVRLGGPAAAWAFTFRYGDFNFAERFVQDCGRERIKLDFIGVHYYGNISSLAGEYEANYPSYVDLFKNLSAARDRYCPGVPIWMTEWGASYNTKDALSLANRNHISGAWGAAYLNQMLECGVDGALFLVTTDLGVASAEGKPENVWGWPSLFVNPQVFGVAYPKPTFHVLDMVSRLHGARVRAESGTKGIGCFASADPEQRRLTVMLWNYDCRIVEMGAPEERGMQQSALITVQNAAKLMGSKRLKIERWEVSEKTSNAYHIHEIEHRVDNRALLQQVESRWLDAEGGKLSLSFDAPPSSVSLIVISAK